MMKQMEIQKRSGLLGLLVGMSAVAAIVALLLLVPSSPMLSTESPVQLFCIVNPAELAQVAAGELDPEWDVIGMPVTVYAAFIAGSFALAMGSSALLGWLRERKAMRGAVLALVCGVCAFICSRLVYCLAQWGAIVNDMSGDAGIDETTSFGMMLGGWLRFLVQPWRGGYTMYGAIFGMLLGVVAMALPARRSIGETADQVVPGMLRMVAAGRAAEHFTAQGMSRWSVSDALNMLPFYSETDYALAVYAYEALAAAAALIVWVVLLCLRAPRGRVAETGLAIVSILQIMLDAWREDELIRFGFVRLNMILAAVVLVALLVLRIVRMIRNSGGVGTIVWSVARCVLFLCSVAAVIIVEFGIDGKFGITASYGVLYAIQAAAIVVMCAAMLIGDGLGKKQAC